MGTAEHLVHGIKGVAGNIGAQSLHDAALSLEKAIKKGRKNKLAALNETFVSALTPILEGLQRLEVVDTSSMNPSEPVVIDSKKMSPMLIQLATHLEEFNLESVPLIDTIHKQLEFSSSAPLCLEMKIHIRNYDFNLARKSLDKLADRLKISLNGLNGLNG